MTLAEAIEQTTTGCITRTGCLWCKTEAGPWLVDDGSNWEPWTSVHETNASSLNAYVEKQLMAFACPGCSE